MTPACAEHYSHPDELLRRVGERCRCGAYVESVTPHEVLPGVVVLVPLVVRGKR